MDLKRVNKINQRYKDIVIGYIKQVQILLPQNNAYYNIGHLINHIILLYYYHVFDSEILSDEDQFELLDLLKKNNKEIANFTPKLLYRSTRDGINRSDFVPKVHGIPNVIVFIHLHKECIIGGFTKCGWDKELNEYDWRPDKDAFVFHLKSPKKLKPWISNIKQDSKSINHALGHDNISYACFGSTWIFDVMAGEYYQQKNHKQNSFEQFPDGHGYLSADSKYDIDSEIQIEAFQMNFNNT